MASRLIFLVLFMVSCFALLAREQFPIAPEFQTQESYNRSAAAYDEKTVHFILGREMAQFTAPLARGATILDLGCGPGRDAKEFIDQGFCVVGVDFSSELLAIAKQRAPNAQFFQQNIEDLSLFSPECFDGIWANASLLHIAKKNLPAVLRQMNQLLKMDGQLFLSLKKGEGEGFESDHRFGGVPKFWAYYHEDEIVRLVKDAGFEVLNCQADLNSRGAFQTHPFIQIFAKKLHRS